MKKLILTLFITSFALFISNGQQNVKMEVGVKAPEWMFKDADGKDFTMNSWSGMVIQVNYVDPDEQDLNEPFNEAINKAVDVDKRIPRELFKGFGIVDCKSTWKPNVLIRAIAGNKAKKYNTTILFDYDGTLQRSWGLPSDSYSVILLDKKRVCRAVYRGKIQDSEIEKDIQLINQLIKE
jgi:predicted transcriptional regulator